MIPLSQTLLLRIFPPRLASAAFGLWSMTTVVAPILGPILGGTLCDGAGWPWVFYINVPIALLVAFLAARLLGRHETATAKSPVDLMGLGLLVVTVGAFQVMLDVGKDLDWFNSTTVVVLAIVAAIGLACFVAWELTDENPVVDLRIFRHRGFTVAASVLSLGYAAFFASIVLIPLWLQTNMGYTATFAGYATAFIGLLAVVMSPIVAALVGKVDSRVLISFGLLWIGGISLWRSGFDSQMNFWAIALPALAQGFAMPFLFVPTSQLALGAVTPAETASAAGLMNFMRTIGGAFAASIATTVWDSDASHNKSELSGLLNGPQGLMDGLIAQGMSPAQALGQLDTLVQGQSVMLATDHVFLATAVVFLLVAGLIWLAPAARRQADSAPSGH
jgi:DHA2 family multidrug resistance protein